MYRYQHDGYILFITLFFIQIFFWLGFYSLNQSSQFYTLIKQRQQLQMLQWEAEKYFKKLLAASNLEQWPCLISLISPIALQQLPLKWWQDHACVGNFNKIRYYYTLEDLGRDDCTFIWHWDNQTWVTTQFYRISLKQVVMFLKKPMIKQAIIAYPSTITEQCQHTPRYITTRTQMQREL